MRATRIRRSQPVAHKIIPRKGHESLTTTAIYLKADLETKERAIARTVPIGTPPGRFQPGDTLLAFLDSL